MPDDEEKKMTIVETPKKKIKVPDDLISKSHAAMDANFKSLILDKSVTNYNHNKEEKVPDGYEYAIEKIGNVEADFSGRFRDYNDERLGHVLTGIYGGTNLPPVRVKKTGYISGPEYTLQDGFHRYIASTIAGFSEIPCHISKDDPGGPIQPKSISVGRKRPHEDDPVGMERPDEDPVTLAKRARKFAIPPKK